MSAQVRAYTHHESTRHLPADRQSQPHERSEEELELAKQLLDHSQGRVPTQSPNLAGRYEEPPPTKRQEPEAEASNAVDLSHQADLPARERQSSVESVQHAPGEERPATPVSDSLVSGQTCR